jgi:Protein of unknown function (DUF2817)
LPGETDPPSGYYSPDYFVARRRFVDACRRRGFRLESLPIDAPSPRDEPLTIDVGIAGSRQPTTALVLSSGIHGVEGCFGSAVQLAYLDALAAGWRPPDGAALVLIHALNPYGFAWRRRFNEENVDLNRNFLLPGEPYSGSPPLAPRFRSVLTPRSFHRRFGFWTARMVLLALRHGISSFWQTLPVGQYDYPEFLYFGGHRASQTAAQLERFLPTIFASTQEVVHVDFHTGLGRWANCELLLAEGEGPQNAAWWREHFPGMMVKEAVSSARSYVIRGGFGPWLEARFAGCHYRYAVAEFGTYAPRRVMAALAEELRWHMQLGNRDADHWSRRQLADVFVPRDRQWRTQALETGLSVVGRASAELWS